MFLACDDSTAPAPAVPSAALAAADPDGPHWAAGYVFANDSVSLGYTPAAKRSYNQAGGTIRITRPAGTIGRYVVSFNGLSTVLGSRNTVKATGYGAGDSYCKPAAASLVDDKIEVRCFKGGSGAAVNSRFTLLVSGTAYERAFAFADRPTAASYAPASGASWNPAGTMTVERLEAGVYEVVFKGLRGQIGQYTAHAQVNAVGAGNAYCGLAEWGGSPDLYVQVLCRTPAGQLVDSKFTALWLTPSSRVAYALGDQPTTPSYSPEPVLSSSPVGGQITITRQAKGRYTVWWTGADGSIFGDGNVQVTAVPSTAGHCKVVTQDPERATVECYAPGGGRVDNWFSVWLGS
jgi:hypothetical protein